MTCTFANTRVPPSRIIRLGNTADEINVGVRPARLQPGESLVFAVDASHVAGVDLCSVDTVTVVEVGTPDGTLTVDNSDVHEGLILLALNAGDGEDGDTFKVTFSIHPTPEQTINARLNVEVNAAA